MLWHLVFFGLLAVCAQAAFAPAPIRWAGLGDKQFVILASAPNSAADPPGKLMVGDPPGKMSPNVMPYFTAKPDNTITWGDDWCLEARGAQSGDGVRVNYCTGQASQAWKWFPWGPIQLIGTNKCLDVVAIEEGFSSGAPIELRECKNTNTERWEFEDPAPLRDVSTSTNQVISFASMVVLGVASIGAWLWRWQKRTNFAIGDTSLRANQDGVCPPETTARHPVAAPVKSNQDWTRRACFAEMSASPRCESPARYVSRDGASSSSTSLGTWDPIGLYVDTEVDHGRLALVSASEVYAQGAATSNRCGSSQPAVMEVSPTSAEDKLDPARRWPDEPLFDKSLPDPVYDNNFKYLGFSSYGFSQRAEVNNGRAAMMGFTIQLLQELASGQGVLQTWGLPYDSGAVVLGSPNEFAPVIDIAILLLVLGPTAFLAFQAGKQTETETDTTTLAEYEALEASRDKLRASLTKEQKAKLDAFPKKIERVVGDDAPEDEVSKTVTKEVAEWVASLPEEKKANLGAMNKEELEGFLGANSKLVARENKLEELEAKFKASLTEEQKAKLDAINEKLERLVGDDDLQDEVSNSATKEVLEWVASLPEEKTANLGAMNEEELEGFLRENKLEELEAKFKASLTDEQKANLEGLDQVWQTVVVEVCEWEESLTKEQKEQKAKLDASAEEDLEEISEEATAATEWLASLTEEQEAPLDALLEKFERLDEAYDAEDEVVPTTTLEDEEPTELEEFRKDAEFRKLFEEEEELYKPLTEVELAEQKAKLDALAEKWRNLRLDKQQEDFSLLGWTKRAEAINGRFAMFFVVTGLVTEYYTGQSNPEQIYTLLQNLAVVS